MYTFYDRQIIDKQASKKKYDDDLRFGRLSSNCNEDAINQALSLIDKAKDLLESERRERGIERGIITNKYNDPSSNNETTIIPDDIAQTTREMNRRFQRMFRDDDAG